MSDDDLKFLESLKAIIHNENIENVNRSFSNSTYISQRLGVLSVAIGSTAEGSNHYVVSFYPNISVNLNAVGNLEALPPDFSSFMSGVKTILHAQASLQFVGQRQIDYNAYVRDSDQIRKALGFPPSGHPWDDANLEQFQSILKDSNGVPLQTAPYVVGGEQQTLIPDTNLSEDALRHAFTSARLAFEYGPKAAWDLTKWHEELSHVLPAVGAQGLQDDWSNQLMLAAHNMDLWNNERAIAIGAYAKEHGLTIDWIINRIKSGMDRNEFIVRPELDFFKNGRISSSFALLYKKYQDSHDATLAPLPNAALPSFGLYIHLDAASKKQLQLGSVLQIQQQGTPSSVATTIKQDLENQANGTDHPSDAPTFSSAVEGNIIGLAVANFGRVNPTTTGLSFVDEKGQVQEFSISSSVTNTSGEIAPVSSQGIFIPGYGYIVGTSVTGKPTVVGTRFDQQGVFNFQNLFDAFGNVSLDTAISFANGTYSTLGELGVSSVTKNNSTGLWDVLMNSSYGNATAHVSSLNDFTEGQLGVGSVALNFTDFMVSGFSSLDASSNMLNAPIRLDNGSTISLTNLGVDHICIGTLTMEMQRLFSASGRLFVGAQTI